MTFAPIPERVRYCSNPVKLYPSGGCKIIFCGAVVIEHNGVYLQRLPTKGDAKKTHTMKTTVQITIAGVALEVEGFFTPEEPQTREDPGMSAEFEVESVTLVNRGDDIFELLTTCISMEDIADAAIEALGQRETPDEYWGGF